MAVNAKGFDETLTETEWALMSSGVGSPWTIESGLTMTPNTSTLPRVVLDPGVVVAHGVRVVVDATETVNFTVPTSGSRWDLLALRVNWSTNSAAVVVVTGGSSKALPSSRKVTPGVEFDVPMMLVRLQSGENRIVDSVSLRVIASKVFQAGDELALPASLRGDAYIRGSEHWRNTGNGWVNIDPPVPAQTEWLLTKTSNQEINVAGEYRNDSQLRATLPAGSYVFDALLRARGLDSQTDVSTRFTNSVAAGSLLYSTMVGTSLTQNLGSDGWDNMNAEVNFSHNGVTPDAQAHNWGTGLFTGSSSIRLSGRLDWAGGPTGLEHKKFVAGGTIYILNGSWLRFSKVA